LYLLAIVAIVAVVGIVVLILNSGSSSSSWAENDISGQAISASKGRLICKDSDGKDSTEKGTVVFGSRTATDACVDSASVTEYYCDLGTIKSTTISCSSGYFCLEGACILECTETDDGNDPYTAGEITGIRYAGDGVQTATDNCLSETTLNEYYCEDGLKDVEQVTCGTYGCYNDACVSDEQTCTDSDGGVDYTVKGTVTGTWLSTGDEVEIEDRCGTTSDLIIEFKCNKHNYAFYADSSSGVRCPSGTTCSDGACV
jgi:hypothetical protein